MGPSITTDCSIKCPMGKLEKFILVVLNGFSSDFFLLEFDTHLSLFYLTKNWKNNKNMLLH
jgi:hypothetical protein